MRHCCTYTSQLVSNYTTFYYNKRRRNVVLVFQAYRNLQRLYTFRHRRWMSTWKWNEHICVHRRYRFQVIFWLRRKTNRRSCMKSSQRRANSRERRRRATCDGARVFHLEMSTKACTPFWFRGGHGSVYF